MRIWRYHIREFEFSMTNCFRLFFFVPFFQRKTWLREALTELCKGQMDEVEQMKQCLAVLCKEGSERERGGEEDREDDDEDDERETAFEMLSELCENLDNARGNKWY